MVCVCMCLCCVVGEGGHMRSYCTYNYISSLHLLAPSLTATQKNNCSRDSADVKFGNTKSAMERGQRATKLTILW